MPPAAAGNLGYTPPDGGWGWAVVLGAFISIGFSYAFPKSLTIYYKEIQEYFSVSYSQIAWVSSVMLAAMYAGGEWKLAAGAANSEGQRALRCLHSSPLRPGPLSSILVNRYGSRPVVMVGGLMVSAGMMLASFGTSIIHLYLCVGIISGKHLDLSAFSMSRATHGLLTGDYPGKHGLLHECRYSNHDPVKNASLILNMFGFKPNLMITSESSQ